MRYIEFENKEPKEAIFHQKQLRILDLLLK